MCICAAAMRILVNKSHNNAVITKDVFLFVYVIILFVLYACIILLWNSGGGGGGGLRLRGGSQCALLPLYGTLYMDIFSNAPIFKER